MIFKKPFGVFLLDFLFMMVLAFSTLFHSMAYSDGSVRYFTLFGELAGLLCVNLTLGRFTPAIFRLIIKYAGKIIKIVTGITRKIAKKLLQDVENILYNKHRKKERQS